MALRSESSLSSTYERNVKRKKKGGNGIRQANFRIEV
jgi:hypothetical protein